MKWSWQALQETPLYVRHTFWDFLQIRRRIEQNKHDEAMRKARGGGNQR